jgi:hypothetical protein
VSRIAIHQFDHDAETEEKYAAHGLSARMVDQVLNNDYKIVPNRKDRAGTYLVLGRDDGGTCIAIPVRRGFDPGTWRPLTAWRCKDREEAALNRKGGLI